MKNVAKMDMFANNNFGEGAFSKFIFGDFKWRREFVTDEKGTTYIRYLFLNKDDFEYFRLVWGYDGL